MFGDAHVTEKRLTAHDDDTRISTLAQIITREARLWTGDQDMSQTRQPRWPLLDAKPLDLFTAP